MTLTMINRPSHGIWSFQDVTNRAVVERLRPSSFLRSATVRSRPRRSHRRFRRCPKRGPRSLSICMATAIHSLQIVTPPIASDLFARSRTIFGSRKDGRRATRSGSGWPPRRGSRRRSPSAGTSEASRRSNRPSRRHPAQRSARPTRPPTNLSPRLRGLDQKMPTRVSSQPQRSSAASSPTGRSPRKTLMLRLPGASTLRDHSSSRSAARMRSAAPRFCVKWSRAPLKRSLSREGAPLGQCGRNPRLRPLHLVVRETEFCGLRLAGEFRRRMRENSRNSVRRPASRRSPKR